MKNLLNWSLNRFIVYSALVLALSIPAYYVAINQLWQYELDEHKILLTAEADREDRVLIIGAVTILTFLFFALLLVGFVLLNRRISRQLWRPFYDSLHQIKTFDLSHHRQTMFGKSQIVEFNELNEGLQKLIQGSITTYDQQKDFTDNASHELQTPLAIIQSKLENLAQDNSLTEQQYTLIDDALRAVHRIIRINKNLLLLSKIGNSQFSSAESFDMSTLLNRSLFELAAFAETKDITIDQSVEPLIKAEGNITLSEILLDNLLINAIRHSAQGAKVFVGLDKNFMTVKNAGLSSLDRDSLFDRFSKVSKESVGTGLGLSIIQKICATNSWDIDYRFEVGMHSFTVKF